MRKPRVVSIWWFAFGYFAAYVPYSFLTKALSKGLLPGMHGQALAGFSLLPLSVGASAVSTLLFLTGMRWWRYATHRTVGRLKLPTPTLWTFLSGLCTAGIIATTTLAYTFSGISIVFAMLLMKGGVLIIAPVVDAVSGRKVRWFSAMGLVFSLGALIAAFTEHGGYTLTLIATVDIVLYLLAYFIRFQFMSRIAKTDDPAVNRRYFVEEQMVASPVLFAFLGILALSAGAGPGILGEIRSGFVDLWGGPALGMAILVGVFSQGTGIFGSLVYLDPRENTFCVPVNRSSSILAGVISSSLLAVVFGQRFPSVHQLVGAGLILAAITFLTIPPMLEKRRQRLAVSGEVATTAR